MKTKHIFAIVISIAVIGIATYIVIVMLSFFDRSVVEYTNFNQAKSSGKKVQIIGSWVKDSTTKYDPNANVFSFYMLDKSNKICKIIYHGSQPSNFKVAPYFVVKGKFQDDNFIASDIYLKCPSKYESEKEKLEGK